MKKKVIIIGAGTIGLHCAWYLNAAGHEVEVIEATAERNESGCSYGNCGYIVPSHFIPLASPGMLRSGLKMLFDRKSPVYLPVTRNIGSVWWFLKFMASANTKQVNKVVPTLYRLNARSHELYRELTAEPGNQTGYEHRGLLLAATTDEGLHEEVEIAEIAGNLGIKTRLLDSAGLKKFEPGVDFNLKGAVLYDSDGHIDPVQHMRWLKTALKQRGVQFHYSEPVGEFEWKNGQIGAVKTGKGRYQADEFVLATGAFSSKIAAGLKLSLPVIAGKGYSIDFPKADLGLKTPMILTEAKVALTPLHNTVRLGSGMEFNGQVGQVRLKRLQAILDRTHQAIPTFPQKQASTLTVWEGLRPLTPDGVPLIGRTNQTANLLIAAGHAMMGASLGPVTGQIISNLVDGSDPGFDLKLLHPNRFD